MKEYRPIIGITMGDPVGIGCEIILSALCNQEIYRICRPVVFGDAKILEAAKKYTGTNHKIISAAGPEACRFEYGTIDVINISNLPDTTLPGKPTIQTGSAMIGYITAAIDMAVAKSIAAIVTCPINKIAMKMAGSKFAGHTELLADRTGCGDFSMMLAGEKLKVVLVTIHKALKDVPFIISKKRIYKTIIITARSLQERFGCKDPSIAVAGLNPHAGEDGMFGDEEATVIAPAIDLAKDEGVNVSGPFPPDTVFYHALNGRYQAVVCMYHDQGLIPFKLIHFKDGVNTTLGLPIIRTSVDHGTAYDIAGTGKADPGSLIAAIKMAVAQTINFLKK